jgi:hypothetical protein
VIYPFPSPLGEERGAAFIAIYQTHATTIIPAIPIFAKNKFK